MDGELTILEKIRSNPLLYLGEKNLQKLFIFLDGFTVCEQFHNPKYISPLLCFNDFVTYKYHDCTGSLYSVIRKQTQTEDMAFNLFFDILDEFLQLEPYKKCRFYFEAVNLLFNKKSITPLKNFFDYNIEVYPDYAEFPQFVNDYYKHSQKHDWTKLILENTDSKQQSNIQFEQLLEAYLKFKYEQKNQETFL